MLSPVIQFSAVHKYYGRLHVLKGLDLTVYPGEKLVLMGPSGCGKSSLLRCINALEWIDGGTAVVNETALHERDKLTPTALNRFRADIGMVFQQFNLFPHLTVLENIMLGPVKVKGVSRGEAEETARTLLTRVGIADKWQAYPEQLSGGQKQRVAIARCLAMKPRMILLDEPTSALDPPMTTEVLKVIETVAEEGMTMLIVTHETRFARRVADRIVFLHEGRVEEEGRPDQVIDTPISPVLQTYFGQIC